MRSFNRYACLMGAASLYLAATLPPASAQPAPARRAVVPADAAPEAMSGLFADLSGGEQTIDVPGAAWLQLQLAQVRLGEGGVLTITAASGDAQSFSQAQIDAWGGLSAVFNGSQVRITLTPGADAAPVSTQVADIISACRRPTAAPRRRRRSRCATFSATTSTASSPTTRANRRPKARSRPRTPQPRRSADQPTTAWRRTTRGPAGSCRSAAPAG